MNIQRLLHILRNPYGHSTEEMRQAREEAADLIESLEPISVAIYRREDGKLLTISRVLNGEMRSPDHVYVPAYADRRLVPEQTRAKMAQMSVARLFQRPVMEDA